MTLLAPDPHRIGRPPGEPAPDRAPDRLARGTPEPLRGELERLLGAGQVLARPLDLVRYASDASPYRRFPQAVVLARHEADIVALHAFARQTGRHVTYRSGGTSLNGQAQSDGILVDTRRHWSGVRVLDGGARARVKPGTVLGMANRVLARHGRVLGPDPASTDIATAGGVIANNAGGMRCGTTWDSYSTVESLRLVLASGTVIDTAAPDAEARFARDEPALAEGLVALRDELRADAELAERVRRKFAIKNTTGYRLCALLDADSPLEIFRRLVIGSEGTLAFVAEAVFRTRRLPPRTATAWLFFDSIDAAVQPVPALVEAGARAVELMVAPALIAASHLMPGTPEDWRELPFESAALLVELAADDDGGLDDQELRAGEILREHELLRAPAFTRDAHDVELAWRVREGLFGLVGKLRPAGSALIIEDVCVPPERIAECAHDLQALLGEHGFLTGVAGHASAGNLHFQLTPAFGDAADVERYERFMQALIPLIVDKYDGSLKSEHGTGLNMAPYVEREWGARATAMMWRIKQLADPHGILNPGVVLNRDPGVHLRDLKTTPPIEEELTTCVECGFCEPVCPSRNATTTPRQRIVLRRELARQPEGSPVYEALLADFEYDAIQTCAADGSCRLPCPVAIDTGKAMKAFRAQERSEREQRLGQRVAQRYALAERAARAALRSGGALPGGLRDGALRALRTRVSTERVPTWPDAGPPQPLPLTTRAGAAAVYLPACLNRMFGDAPVHALVTVSARAGLPLWIPDDVAGVCCGQPWESKGLTRGRTAMADRVRAAAQRWTEGGRLPLVIDASSCAHALGELEVEALDAVAWAQERLLPRLTVRPLRSVAVHPTCAGEREPLERLAGALADAVVVPAGTTCCGMAGDRGLLHPELPRSALRDVASELAERPCDAYVSSNRTCEIGLRRVTGRPYVHIVSLLEELTRRP